MNGNSRVNRNNKQYSNKEAINLPIIISEGEIGEVRSSSIVLFFFSSLINLIVSIGETISNIKAPLESIGVRLAIWLDNRKTQKKYPITNKNAEKTM
jgi:hypothetical protein